MKTFIFKAENGKIRFANETVREMFATALKKNDGARFEVNQITPESAKERKFFEGAVVPLVTFFQENMDYRNGDDNRRSREWLKIEFVGEPAIIGGKLHKVPGTTKGKLREGFIDEVIDWIEENYGIDRSEVLDPKKYKHWRDEIFPYGGPDNYIDYLVEMGKLKAKT